MIQAQRDILYFFVFSTPTDLIMNRGNWSIAYACGEGTCDSFLFCFQK